MDHPTSYARIRRADGVAATASWLPDGTLVVDGRTVSPEDVTWLPPVVPTKVVCVGFNYRPHADEMSQDLPEEPLVFFKPPSALIAAGDEIVRPSPDVRRLDYEGELVVVMGRRARNVSEADALDHVEGLTVGNDVTAREYQVPGSQWTQAKGYDTFAPLGPTVVRTQEWAGRRIETRLNGTVVQSSTTDRMIFSVPRIICWVSAIMTLEPGDVIYTGTPAGVGPMADGDHVQVTVEGIGTLHNTVVAHERALEPQALTAGA